MGPFEYKTVMVNVGFFGAFSKAGRKLGSVIDKYVAGGWELFKFEPLVSLGVWQWNVMIFRRPSDSAD